MIRSLYRRFFWRTDRELLEIIMADLTRLNAAVAANTAAVAAVVAALSVNDQAAIDAAATQIETNNTALTTAITPPSTV